MVILSPVTISGVQKARKGAAGELRGYFSSSNKQLAICLLILMKVFMVNWMLPRRTTKHCRLRWKQEVKEGPAQILTTVADGEPQYYNVTIEA